MKSTKRQNKQPETRYKLDDAAADAAISDPTFRAAFDHLDGVWNRAKAGTREDKDIETTLVRHVMTNSDSIIEVVWKYAHIARDLRRQLLEQLAKRQGDMAQGQLFE